MQKIYIHDEITHNSRAAGAVLPMFFQHYKPASVLDVGCGLGNWLEVCKQLGVPEVKGIDGDYVNKNLLRIHESEFQSVNLNEVVDLKKRYDLAICLEVAEHLLPESSGKIIDSLINHSDVILFSAAIPGQGGQYHINEQWPSYWQKLFDQRGYEMLDYFRPQIWNNENIEYWYRQNLFLVVKKGHEISRIGSNNILSLVHPELFEKVISAKNEKILQLRRDLARLSRRDIIGRIRRLFNK